MTKLSIDYLPILIIYATADEAVAYILQMFFFYFLFVLCLQKYETTVLGNG